MPSKSTAAIESLAVLRQRIAAGSQDLKDYANLASLAFSLGNIEEAITLHEQSLRLPLPNLQRAQVRLDLAWLFHWQEKPNQAKSQAEEARSLLQIEAESSEVIFLRGVAESLIAQSSTGTENSRNAAHLALGWLNRLMSEYPDSENIGFAHIQAARLHNLLRNPKDAIKACTECLKRALEPDDRMECLLELIEALQSDGQFAEAERTAIDALKWAGTCSDKLPRIYCTLGIVLRSARRPADAREAFQKALVEVEAGESRPDKVTVLKEAYWNLGQLYYEIGEYEDSIKVLQRLLPLYPDDNLYRRNVLGWLGQSYHEAGNLVEARLCYEQVLNSPDASQNEKATIQQGIGKIFYDLENYEDAIAAFQTVVTHFSWEEPFYGDTLLWLGNCYYAKGEYGKASECYEKVLLSPSASEKERTSAEEYIAQVPKAFRVRLQ